jgi:hypothetical protein
MRRTRNGTPGASGARSRPRPERLGVERPICRLLLGVCVSLLFFFSTLSFAAAPAKAGTEGLYGTVSGDYCFNSYSSGTDDVLQDAGYTGYTWSFLIKFGLDGNDNTQYTSFYFYVEDSYGDQIVGWWGDTHLYWTAQGAVDQGTITVPITDYFSMTLVLDNPDSQSQCYTVEVTEYFWQ